MNNKDKLIEKLEEYIILLEEEVGRYTTLSLTHSWIGLASVEVIEKGEKLREEIKTLKSIQQDSRFSRIGLFTYREIEKDKYEVGLDIPIKFTKKNQKELEEYVGDVFGEDSQFKVVGEDTVATKRFIIERIKALKDGK